ncbi:MAG: TmcC family electron transfer complex membrane anchor subunit [Pseudomonadota bacterium]
MPEYLRIPVWLGFIGLFGGGLYKLVSVALLARREKTVFPTLSLKYGLRSLGHWLLPFGGRTMQQRPVMTLVSWLFHGCLVVTPLFTRGHSVLLEQRWGLSWFSLPAALVDGLTLTVVFACLFFLTRRLVAPEVRKVSGVREFALVLLVMSPYLTGFFAHQQWLPYEAMIVLHVVCGVLWLVAIPLTWLSHMLWFVFTRAYMGSEFGAVRHARDW